MDDRPAPANAVPEPMPVPHATLHSRSTIAARVALLLLLPFCGVFFFGLLVGLDERRSALTARELRQEAELVELLSSTAVELDVEVESLVGLQAAGTLNVDMSKITWYLGQDSVELFEADEEFERLVEDLERVPEAQWAAPDAIARFVAVLPEFDAMRSSTDMDPVGIAVVRAELDAAIGDALTAQAARLNTLVGVIELRDDLAALAHAREPSLSLMHAALDERRALADYVLPLSERDDGQNYRNLVTASAHYDFVLAELKADLPAAHQEALDIALESDDYDLLRAGAIEGDIVPLGNLNNPLSYLDHGLVIYVDGFARIDRLLEVDRALSAEFTAGAAELEAMAQARLRYAVGFGTLFAAIALTGSIVTIRSITRPVWALLTRARRITEGDLTTEGPRSGPSDIGLVHKALDEMSANLRTLTDQAEALSDGRLDDEVLARNVAGPLAASVHGSVARLRSMTTRLEYEATHDALTRLPNRAAVMSFLDRCLTGAETDRQPLAAVMLDLDGFKQANDDMGHTVGDEVLIHVADRLRSSASSEFVARLGGDEFMIVVAGPGCVERARAITDSCVRAIGETIVVSNGSIELAVSAGIVATDGPAWLSPVEVLRRVDIAMYEAKSGRSDVVMFDKELHDSLLETARLQGEIRLAVDRGEFELAFQPIVVVDDLSIVGYEALIRWQSPMRGTVPPGLFIPVAEQSGLIDRIDDWVLTKAGEILRSWQDDPARQNLTLSVNVSARHLSNNKLVRRVSEVLSDHDLRADRLLIEVTESQLIPNLARAEDTLRGLRHLGVRLAIDDFGTGYASVAHLRSVKFDRLKIDQGFLANVDDDTERSLAALLVSLGRDLGLEVVAEGIETQGQLEWAVNAGCTHLQGFMLGRPKTGRLADRRDRRDPGEELIAPVTGRSGRRG